MGKQQIAKFRKPTNAHEMARVIQLFLVDQWDPCISGGVGKTGGDMDIDLGDDVEESINITVISHEESVLRDFSKTVTLDEFHMLSEIRRGDARVVRAHKKGGVACVPKA